MAKRIVLVCALLLSATAAPAQQPGAPDRDAADRRALVEQVVRHVNRQRALNGVRPVELDDRLTAAAQKHTDDMAKREYFDHKSPDGRGVSDRVRAEGYSWRVVAENIGGGISSPVALVNSWMTSPEHRDNMLGEDVVEIGVGYAPRPPGRPRTGYSHYWTAIFAASAR